MNIAAYVLKAKLRRKDIYIVSAICALVVLLFSSGNSSLTIGGKSITSYASLLPIMFTVVLVFSGALTVALCLSTIPNEYKQGTSHLVWVRGVSQPQYHGGLLLGNLFSSIAILGFSYLGLVLFILAKGEFASLAQLPFAFLVSCVPIAFISIFTSVISISLPGMVGGLLGVLALVLGVAHPLFSMLANVLSGFVAQVVRTVLKIIPNLYALQTQAANVVLGKPMDAHCVLGGIFACYLLTHLLFVFKKKEAQA